MALVALSLNAFPPLNALTDPSSFMAPLMDFVPKDASSFCKLDLGPHICTSCVGETLKTKFQTLSCLLPSNPGSSFSAFFFFFFFSVFLPFLGPLPRHMEVPRLGV